MCRGCWVDLRKLREEESVEGTGCFWPTMGLLAIGLLIGAMVLLSLHLQKAGG